MFTVGTAVLSSSQAESSYNYPHKEEILYRRIAMGKRIRRGIKLTGTFIQYFLIELVMIGYCSVSGIVSAPIMGKTMSNLWNPTIEVESAHGTREVSLNTRHMMERLLLETVIHMYILAIMMLRQQRQLQNDAMCPLKRCLICQLKLIGFFEEVKPQ